jgi:hypothetical protein
MPWFSATREGTRKEVDTTEAIKGHQQALSVSDRKREESVFPKLCSVRRPQAPLLWQAFD